MIPLSVPVNRKREQEFLTCFHCGTRLSARSHTTKKFCLDCEEKKRHAHDRAKYAVKKAISEGNLVAPDGFACVDCGKPAYCYDHRDYSKPLVVEPVCKSCNNRRGPARLGDTV